MSKRADATGIGVANLKERIATLTTERDAARAERDEAVALLGRWMTWAYSSSMLNSPTEDTNAFIEALRAREGGEDE
jgi:hypothetical protein